jgi:uncharacterized protein YjbI with pentapeptide repeats
LREGLLYRHHGRGRGEMEIDSIVEGEETNFFRADLSNAKLGKSIFRGAKMSGAILANASLADADFSGCDLTGSDMRGADLSGANLTDAKLIGARLVGVTINKTILTNADLTGLTAEDIAEVKPWAKDAKYDAEPLVRTAILPDEVLAAHEQWIASNGREGKQAIFDGADLSRADFSNKILRLVTLRNCNLVGAKFTATRLFAVDLSGSDLRHTDFRGARIVGTRFDRTDLFNANFSGSRIGALPLVGSGGNKLHTSFRGSTVSRGVLAGADVLEADFSGSPLANVTLPTPRRNRPA